MAGTTNRSTEILDAVALLVVDMQAQVLGAMEAAGAVTARCGFAIEAARTCGLRVLFTEQVPAKLGGTDPRLRTLAPDARVFAKESFSAMQAEGLQDDLKKHGIYHLLVAGIETPVCVYQTALHAIESDFDVTILSDCVGGRRNEDGRIVLESLTRANCHVLPAEAVFYSMLASSAHPNFRAFTEIVKRYSGSDPLSASQLQAQPDADKPIDETPPSAPPAETERTAKTRRGGRRRRKPGSSSEASPPASSGDQVIAPETREEPRPAAAPEHDANRAAAADVAKPHQSRRRRGGSSRRRTGKTGSEPGPPPPVHS